MEHTTQTLVTGALTCPSAFAALGWYFFTIQIYICDLHTNVGLSGLLPWLW